jgi:peptidoglycan/LPS O-acetylase OafA/YrhL
MSKRIAYFDVLRGLAIICVIAIHSSGMGFQFPDDSFNFNFTILSRQFFNVSVPLFLAISGYFLAKKNISNRYEYIDFLKKQIPRVYIPLFVWSLVWVVLGMLILNKPLFKEMIKLVIFQSSGPYYFIALLIQYYILFPILKPLANLRGLIISLCISLATVGIIFYIRNYMGINLPLILYAGNFPVFLVFFVLGLHLGSIEKINLSNKLLVSLMLFFYFLAVIESYFLYSLFGNGGLAATAMKPSSFMFSLCLIVFLFRNIDLFQSKILEYLGKISFGIYLIHVFMLSLIPPPAYQVFSNNYRDSIFLSINFSFFNFSILFFYYLDREKNFPREFHENIRI